MKVLILSKDPSLLEKLEVGHIGDSKKRHKFYANFLQGIKPNSEIKVITYTRKNYSQQSEYLSNNIEIIGTCSFSRFFYFYDLSKVLYGLLKRGYIPDVITAQTPWEEGLIGLAVSKFYNIKFIPQLHFDLFSKEWLNESGLNIIRKWVAHFVISRSDKVRVVSTCLKYKLIENFHIPANKIYVAPVGVNFTAVFGNKEDYKRKISPLILNHKIVLFVGRLCNQKNMKLWLDVAKQVSTVLPDVCFVIVGDGEDEQSLRKYAADLKLSSKCFFLGKKDHDVLPQIYAASDLFLLSSHYEGFGRVVLESMKAGVPVISTRSCGPEDLILDKVNGYLEPADSSVLTKRLIELLTDDKKRESFSNAAVIHVEEKFSLEKLTEKMVMGWFFD